MRAGMPAKLPVGVQVRGRVAMRVRVRVGVAMRAVTARSEVAIGAIITMIMAITTITMTTLATRPTEWVWVTRWWRSLSVRLTPFWGR